MGLRQFTNVTGNKCKITKLNKLIFNNMTEYYISQDSKGKWKVSETPTETRVTTNAIETYLKFLNKKPKVKKETSTENEG